eukprot:scaffold28349_cov65-Phaeocystis_antarctica.AAC.2
MPAHERPSPCLSATQKAWRSSSWTDDTWPCTAASSNGVRSAPSPSHADHAGCRRGHVRKQRP